MNIENVLKLSPAEFAEFMMNLDRTSAEKLVELLRGTRWEQHEYKFPLKKQYQGKTWVFTGKTGTNIKTHVYSGEYDHKGDRIWVDIMDNVVIG